MEKEKSGKSRVWKVIIVVVFVVIIAVIGYFVVTKVGFNQTSKKTVEGISADGNKYQAVFLTNGQVYFGKLIDDGGNYVRLNDIYYLQSKDQSVQPKDSKQATDQSNLTLIKLGKELHAPADEMNISRQQLLFWENIEDRGKVMQAIKEYKSSNK